MNAISSALRSSLLACLAGAIAIIVSLPAVAAELAGQFLFVVGDVRIQTAGKERPARVGDQVREGDTIITAASGEAQLRMVDDAFVAVRRDTQLRIDQYNYKGRNDGTESGVLNLVKGTFRALTGLIVKSNRQNFAMKTAVSTIGIRGTGNITHHDANTNTTTNHTVTGSHAVTSIDATTGRPIGITVITQPGMTIQVQAGQPPRQVTTPRFILAEATRDPKAKKAEPEKKEEEKKAEPRSTTLAKAETETRETDAAKPKEEPKPAPTAHVVDTPAALVIAQVVDEVAVVTSAAAPAETADAAAPAAAPVADAPPPAPAPAPAPGLGATVNSTSLSEQQNQQANLLLQIETAYRTLQAATSSLATLSTTASSAATSAATSSASAAAVAAVDLTTLDAKIATASSLVTFAPSIQSSVTAAQSQRATAFNAAGLGNTSSTLATAQTAAAKAATAAATASASVPGLVATASADAAAAQTTYLATTAALDANNIALALQLLDTLNAQVATAVASAAAAAAATNNAKSAAETAASQLTAATSAASTANTSATTALASADTAINTALGNVQAIAAATASTRDSISAISTALGATLAGTTAQQAYDAANTANTTAQSNAATIAGIAAINTTTATSNAASVTTLANTAQGQVTTATSVNTANSNVTNGVGGTDFRDSQAAAALTSMNTANTAVQGALTSATSASSTAATQGTSLTTAKSSAATQSGSATTAFGTAQTNFNSLTAAAQVDTGATNANQTVANLLSLANTAATNAQTFANLGTQQGALDAQAEFNKSQAYLAAAQKIQTIINQGGTVATAQTALTTLLSDANAAKTAGDAAVATTTTALSTATTNAPTVAAQSVIAQYSNPIVVTSNRFTSVSVGAKQVTGGSERFQHFVIQKPNTNFVLDGQKSLVESRVTNQMQTDLTGTLSSSFSNTDMTIVGGTPADIFVSSSNAVGSENYVALGRVTGGLIQSNGTTVVDLGTGAGARSFHWILGYEPPAGYVSSTKLTGTTTYSKIGNTTPTDASGNTGTLNSATFSANFSTLTATAGVNVTIASKTLDAAGGNISLNASGAGTPQFGGPFATVNCTGTGCSGTYGGDLTGSLTGTKADGAGFVYSLRPATSAGAPYTDLIQGAVAFLAGTPPVPAPQPATNFATAYLWGGGNFAARTFEASGSPYSSVSTYTLDGNNDLTQVAQNPINESEPGSEVITGGTAQTKGTATSTGGTVVDFGRWQGPGVSVAAVEGGVSSSRAVDGSYHWIKGPPVGPFYLTSALASNNPTGFTGTATYTAQGGSVTDQAGVAGTLGTTTLSVNFTQQAVNVDINATTGANTWRGVANGIALDGGSFRAAKNPGGTEPHHLLDVYYNSSNTGTFGALDGMLMGNGADAAGVGFAFTHSGGNKAAGTVAFTGAAQSQTTSNVPGIIAAGKLGTPLSAAGAATTGTTTLASLDPEFVNAVEATVNASTRVSRDGAATPQVVRFDSDAPVAQPTGCSSTGTACTGVSNVPAQFTLRDSAFPLDTPPGPGAPALPTTLTNTGSDSTTGITWGRYVGFVAYADRITTTTGAGANTAVSSGAFDARTSNWHGIWGPTATSLPTLPSSGTITYTAVGGTNPSDSANNVGTWSTSTATLSANFTAMTVNTSVNAIVGPNTWAASASNIPIVSGTYFQAQKGAGQNSLTVTCTGTCAGATAGKVVGIFTGNAATGTNGGAMLGYSLNAGGATGTTMQGVTAFKK